MTHQTIIPSSLKETYEELQYAPATRAGNMLFLSGVLAMVEDGETDLAPAINRMFDEIEMILSEAGATWLNVVDVTSYSTDLDNHLDPLWTVKAERVSAPYPSWTLIGTNRLYGGDAAIIETKVTAYLPD
jgi:enamine deaminase RidA (YjgF/YER057c/UK114 family)